MNLRRFIALFLALTMIFSLAFPGGFAFADDDIVYIDDAANDEEEFDDALEEEYAQDEHIHNLTYYPEAAASCAAPGNYECWYCADCGKFYADEACEYEVAFEELAIPATDEHSFLDGVCAVCGAEDPDYVAPAAVMLASALAEPVVEETNDETPVAETVIEEKVAETPVAETVVEETVGEARPVESSDALLEDETSEDETSAAAPAAELQTPTLAAVNTPVLGLSLQAEQPPMLSEGAVVAKIGETGYPSIAAAVGAAQDGNTVEITAAGNYTLPGLPQNITIKGTVGGVVFDHTGTGNIAAIPNGATFENVTFNFGNENYHGFQQAGAITMKNCTLNGKLFSYGSMDFTECTFNNSSDYVMWVYGNATDTVNYTSCTINGNGKFLHLYSEQQYKVQTVNVNKCTFINNGSSNKAAVNVKATCNSTPLNYTVNIDNSSTTGDFPAASTSDTLVVLSNLVQVDDIKEGVASVIKVTLDDEQVFPKAEVHAISNDSTDKGIAAEIDSGFITNEEVTVGNSEVSAASVTFNAAAAQAIATATENSSLTLKIEDTTEKQAAGTVAQSDRVFSINLVKTVNNEEFSVFNAESVASATDAKATVTVPYAVTGDNQPLVYLVSGETKTPVAVDHFTSTAVTFTVEHFSDYLLTQSAPVARVTVGDTITNYVSLHEALTYAATCGKNAVVELLNDIDLANAAWDKIELNGYSGAAKEVTIQGKNHYIKGLTSPLIFATWSSTSIKIYDLTIKDSVIEAVYSSHCGGNVSSPFIGSISASYGIVFNNCHSINCVLNGGKYSGGLYGYANGYSNQNDGPAFSDVTIVGCSVENCTINGSGGSAGALVGHATGDAWTSISISDTTATGNKITGENEQKTGLLIGTLGAGTTFNGRSGGVTIDAQESGNTAFTPEGQLTDEKIHVFGRSGSGGKAIITGGTYSVDPTKTSDSNTYANSIAPAEDYKIVENANGTFGVAQMPAVAYIGTTGYTTLAKALAAVQENEIKIITIVAGTYDLPATTVIPAGVTIRGEGKSGDSATTLTITTTNGDGLKITNQGVKFENLAINGENITSGGYESLINVEADGCVIDNVVMRGGGKSTWNSSILVERLTAGQTFTVRNSNISGSFRGVLRESCNANIVIENCEIDAVYPFNIDGGNGGTVTVTGGALHGWTSYGGVDKVTFNNVEFSKGNSGYNAVAAYVDTKFEECAFVTGNINETFNVYAQITGFNFTFNECTKDGVGITDDNLPTMFSDSDVWSKCETAIDVETNENGAYSSGTVVSTTAPTCANDSHALKIGASSDEKSSVFKIGSKLEISDPISAGDGKYTVTLKLLKSDDSVIYEKEDQEITVKAASGVTITGLDGMATVVKNALKNAGAWATDVDTVELSLDPPPVSNDSNTYTVVLKGTPKNGETSLSEAFAIANADFSDAEFSFTLPVTNIANDTNVKVEHKNSSTGEIYETFYPTVANGEVPVTVTHFSTFTVSELQGSGAVYNSRSGVRSESIAAALSDTNFASRDTLVLLADLGTADNRISVTNINDDVTIDLHGNTIYATGTGFTVGAATLTLKDSGSNGALNVTTDKTAVGVKMSDADAVFNLESGSLIVSGTRAGRGIDISDGYEVTVTGGVINAGNNGIAINNSNITAITVEEEASLIGGNYAINNTNGGTATISSGYIDGKFSGNGITLSGGFYSVDPDADYIESGKISWPYTDATYKFKIVPATTLTFNAGDGAFSGGSKTVSFAMPKGVTTTFSAAAANKGYTLVDPAYYGHIFDGWFLNEEEFDADAEITLKDATIYTAKWSEGVAAIGDTYYKTLNEAVSAAQNGQTVTLLKDYTEKLNFSTDKRVTLDLSDHTLSGGIYQTAGNLIVNNGTIAGQVSVDGAASAGDPNRTFTLGENATIDSVYGIILWEVNNNSAYSTTINVNGTVHGNVWVMGNITQGDSTINIRGTVDATGKSDVGVALNGMATVNVYNGATVTSEMDGKGTGIEVRSGTLNVSGGTITGTGAYSFNSNGSGTTSTGVGIAVAQHTTEKNIQVNISGNPVVSGTVALALANPETNDDGRLNVNVTNGTFNSTGSGNNAVAVVLEEGEKRVNGFISGGTFSSPLETEYCATGYIPATIGSGVYSVGQGWKVTFDENNNTDPVVVPVAKGDSVEVPEDPTYNGHTFVGWYNGQERVADFFIPTEDTTITAAWTQDNLYQVHIDNWYYGDTPSVPSVTYTDSNGNIATVPDNYVKYTYTTKAADNFYPEVPISNLSDAREYFLVAKVTNFETYTDSETAQISFRINPRPVTLTSASETKVYDTTALTNSTVNVSGEGFVGGQGATYDVTGTQTKVGSSENKFTYTLNNGTNPNNYTITTVNGTLTVTTKVVTAPTITFTDGFDYTYDGTAKKPGVTVYDGETVIPDSEYTLSYSNNTNAGTATVTITDNVDGNYDVNGSANFTITKRPVTVTWTTLSVPYDGKPHAPEFTTEGLISADGYSVVVKTGEATSVVNAGTVMFTAEFNDNAARSNYTWASSSGYYQTNFTITKAPLTVTAKNHTITYGDAPANNGVEYSGFVNGEDANVLNITNLAYAYNYEQYGNVGNYTITPSGITADNYVITYVPGTLTVSPKAITVEAKDASKIAGNADPNFTYTMTPTDGIVTGDTITVTYTRNPADDNAVSSVITPAATVARGDVDVTGNYSFNYQTGTLTITPAVARSSADGTTWEYYTSFEKALAAIYKDGGTVELLANDSYNMWYTNVNTWSDGTAGGSGVGQSDENNGAVTIIGNNHTLTFNDVTNPNGKIVLFKTKELNVQNLTINLGAGLTAFYPESGTIKNVTFSGGQYGMVYRWSNNAIKVDECEFNNQTISAIDTGYATKAEITNSEFNNCNIGVFGNFEKFTGNTISGGTIEIGTGDVKDFTKNDFSGVDEVQVNVGSSAKTADLSGNYWGDGPAAYVVKSGNGNAEINDYYASNAYTETHGVVAVLTRPRTTGGTFTSDEYYFTSLKEAFSMAQDGDTVTMLADSTATDEAAISRSITLVTGEFKIKEPIKVTGGTLSITGEGIFAANPTKTGEGKLAISGGYYPNKVLEADCAEDYIPKNAATEGKGYTVEIGTIIARIGEVGYGTLSEALAAANTAGTDTTIKILTDIDETLDVFNVTPHVTFTADEPVTVAVHDTALGAHRFYFYNGATFEQNVTWDANGTTSAPSGFVTEFNGNTTINGVAKFRIFRVVGEGVKATVNTTGRLICDVEVMICVYDGAKLVVNGSGSTMPEEQIHGTIKIDNDSTEARTNTVELNNTFARLNSITVKAKDKTDNKVEDTLSFTANNSRIEVFQNNIDFGDSANTVITLNNSTLTHVLENGNLTLAADQTMNLDATSSITAKTWTNNGKVIVDVSDLAVTSLPYTIVTYTTKTEGSTGTVTLTNNGNNYVLVDNGSEIQIVAPVATVKTSAEDTNPSYYASLADAFDAAQEGNIVTLIADVAVDSIITIDKSLTFDLNGKTVTNNLTKGRAFTVTTPSTATNATVLTVNGNNGGMVIPETNTQSYGFFRIEGPYTGLIVNGGTYTGNTDIGAFFKYGLGDTGYCQQIELNSVTATTNYLFLDYTSWYAGTIAVNGGKYTQNNEGLHSTYGYLWPAFGVGSYGVNSDGEEVEYGVVFEDVEIISAVGSCVDIRGASTVARLIDNKFTVNVTDTGSNAWQNGPISVQTDATAVIESGTYTGNGEYGISTANSGSHVIVNGGTIYGNKYGAHIYGGCEYTPGKPDATTLEVNGGTITGGKVGVRAHNLQDGSGAVNVNITGGTINGGTDAGIQIDHRGTTPANDTVTITGGHISGELVDVSPANKNGIFTIELGTNTKPYFEKDPSDKVDQNKYSVVKETIDNAEWYTLGESVAINTTTGKSYPTLAAAVNAAQPGDTVQLLKNIDLSAEQEFAENLTLDLNGKTITMAEYADLVIISGKLTVTDSTEAKSGMISGDGYGVLVYGGEFELVSGTVEAGYDAVYVGSGTATISGGKLNGWNAISAEAGTVNISGGELTATNAGASTIFATGNATVNVTGGKINCANNSIYAGGTATVNISDGEVASASGKYAVNVNENSKLNVSGNATITGAGNAIGTNGSNTGSVTVKISGGTVSSSNAIAVFMPSGTFEISGGEITGTTAVYVKSGTLDITGGTLTGTGAKTAYTYKSSGAVATGDALVVDNCGYPKGAPVVHISGNPTFTSTNAVGVGSYANGDRELALVNSTAPIENIKILDDEMWVDAQSGKNLVKAVTVDFELNGGTGTEGAYAQQRFQKGGKATKPADPTRSGYTFAGWYLGTAANAFDFANTEVKQNITLVAKWLTNVTIKANSASKTYNGTALTEPGFTTTGLEQGDDHTFIVTMTADSTITNVGTQSNVIATVDGVAVSTAEATAVGNYMVTIEDGSLTVNPKAVTITAGGASKIYNSEPLTESHFTTTALEVGDDHTFTVTMTADSTITNVGTQPNVIATVDDVAVSSANATAVGNYTVIIASGTLMVTPKTVTVTADNLTKVYGDSDPSLTAATSGTIGSDTVSYTLSRAAGEKVGEYGITPSGEAAQGNYTVTYLPGKLTITQRPLTIKVADSEKVLGNEDPAFTYSYEGTLAANETISYSYTKDPANDVVGLSTITPSATIKNGENDVTENYKITATTGTLNILGAVAKSGEKYYAALQSAFDEAGTSGDTITMLADETLSTYATLEAGKTVTLDLAGWNITRNGNCALDIYGDLTLTDSGRDVAGEKTYGKVESGIPVWVNNGGKFTLTSGAINAVGESATGIEADGTAEVTLNGGSVTSEQWGVTMFDTSKLIVNDGAAVNTTVNAAISTNGNLGQNATITINGGKVTSGDIAIYQPSGALTIRGGEITGATAVYFKSTNLNITGGTLTGKGAKAAYDFYGNGANATGDALVIDNCNYPNGIGSISVTGGTFVSTNAQPIASYVGNGVAETAKVKGFVSGEANAEGAYSGPLFSKPIDDDLVVQGKTCTTTMKKNIGGTDYNYIMDAVIISFNPVGGAFIDGSEEIKTLIVAKGNKPAAEEWPVAPSFTGKIFEGWVDYNGAPRTAEDTYDSDIILTAKWETKEFTVSFVTDGGSVIPDQIVNHNAAVIMPTDPTKTGYTFDGWYNGNTAWNFETKLDDSNTTDGKLTLTAKWLKNVTVTADNKSKFVDETDPALTWTAKDSSGQEITSGITVTTISRAEGTEVGTYAITVTGNAKQGDYAVTFVNGTFTINEKSASNVTKAPTANVLTYNGSVQTLVAAGEADFGTVQYSLDGTTFSSEIPTATNAGTYTVSYKATGDTEHKESAVASVEVSIAQAALSITAESADKLFDGQALTKYSYLVTGLVEGDIVSDVTVTGSQTEVGTSSNIPTDGVVKRGETVVTGNYKITYINGTLTVKNAVASVNGTSYETFADAVAAAHASTADTVTITLLSDIDLTAAQVITKSMTIDLNGHNITANGDRALWVKSGDVTITGSGEVSATGNVNASSSVIRVGDSAANDAKAKLTIDDEVIVSSNVCYGVTVFGNNTSGIELVVNGKVNVTGTASAVSGNGTNTLSATTITINGEVTAANDYAIYHPGKGTLTVNGKVEGKGGIEAKGGSVTINDGASVKATASAQTHSAYNNGASTSGYAIAAVSNSNYVGEPAVTINGGTISGKTIILADYNVENKGTVKATVNTLATEPGFIWVSTGEETTPFKLAEGVTVSFDINGAEGTAPIAQTIEKGTTPTKPGDPTRTGYTFAGWYNGTAENAFKFKGEEADTVTEDTTLTAHWNELTYKVSFNLDGGDPAFSEQTVVYGEKAVFPGTPTKAHYSFDGWYNGDKVFSFATPIKANTELTAHWKGEKHNVIFLAADGTPVIQMSTVEYGKTVAEPTVPTRIGYTFAGWFTGADDTAEKFAFTTAITADTVLYAHWTINQYTITWSIDGVETTETYNYGATPTHTDPTKAATAEKTYTFTSWDPAIVEVTGNATYTAQFDEADKEYTVTFDTDGGSEIAPITAKYNTKVTAPDDPTKTGYTFDGWYNGNTAWNFENDTVTSNVTLTAHWTEAVATINGTPYATLADAFAAANGVTTIEVLKDSSGSGIIVPSGSNITVNFNNHTYTVANDPLAGSTGTKTQAFQLLKDSTIVFNKGAIVADNANVKMLIQNYAVLTLNGMTLDANQGSNSVGYVLSTNNGSTKINDTSITAKSDGTAFDACSGWGGYAGNSVEVTGNSSITGNIEVSYYGQEGTAPASLTLTSGTHSGAIVMAKGAEQTTVTKADTYTQTAPEGYAWVSNGNGTSTLKQIVIVTFDLNGGTGTVEAQTIEKGAKATKPETDPTKEDYTFVGWFAPEAEEAFDFGTAITANITLTAKWVSDSEMVKVSVTSSGDGTVTGPTVSFVTGGGTYIPGTQVTVTTTQPTGYRFKGWYKGGAAIEGATALECSITADANCELVAVFEPDGTAKFHLTVTGSKFKVNDGTEQHSRLDEDYAVNGTITLAFTGSEEFLYWINGSNKVVSKNPTYSFVLASDATYTAVYSDKNAEKSALVVFVSEEGANGQVISSRYYAKNEAITKPNSPAKLGKVFSFWTVDGSNAVTDQDIWELMDTQSRVEVYPVYNNAGQTYTVTVVHVKADGSTVIDAETYAGKQIGTGTTITPNDEYGTFSYWSDKAADGEILSYESSYKVWSATDVTRYAIYDKTVTEIPTVAMTGISKSMDGEKYVVSLMMGYNVPSEYKLVRTGILYANINNVTDPLKEMVIGSANTKVFEYRSSLTDASNTVILHVRLKQPTSDYIGRGYLIYQDNSGNTITIYSNNTVNGSYNTISG